MSRSDCHSDHCITCGDEGIPMRCCGSTRARGLALCVAEDGAKSSVEIELVGAGGARRHACSSTPESPLVRAA